MDIADQSNDKGELKIYKVLHVVLASVKAYFYYYNLYFFQRGTVGQCLGETGIEVVGWTVGLIRQILIGGHGQAGTRMMHHVKTMDMVTVC